MKAEILKLLIDSTHYENRYIGGGEEPRIIVFDDCDDENKEQYLSYVADKIINSISNLKIYKVQCLNEDGQIEVNGYHISLESAEIQKKYLDSDHRNKKYGIKQSIIEIKVEDLSI